MMSCLVAILCVYTVLSKKLNDWIIDSISHYDAVTWKNSSENGMNCYVLSNGLIERKFIISPNFGTIEYNSWLSGVKSPILRSIGPESQIGINGVTFNVGGIEFKNLTETTPAYLDYSWITSDNVYTNLSNTFIFNGNVTIGNIVAPYDWKPGLRHSPDYISWPPKGISVQIGFVATKDTGLSRDIMDNIVVYVRYEMFQGMPIISKSVIIESKHPDATRDVYITALNVEVLKVNVPYSPGSNAQAINGVDMFSNQSTFWPLMNMVTYSGGLWLETDQGILV